MSAEPLFLFGTLRHPPLLAVVAGRPLPVEPAHLPDAAVVHAVSPAGVQQKFPVRVARAGARADGLLIRPDPASRARLDAYERVFGYVTDRVRVETGDGPVQATVYLPEGDRWGGGADWALEDWQRRTGALTTEVAQEVMTRLAAGIAPEAIDRHYTMIEAHVAGRGRARTDPAPSMLRRRAGAGDVVLDADRRPYANFFAVSESDLRFRRFDGGFSETVTRAGFMMADAVTVLPYDPARDMVMLVEQYRFGPHLRGDPNPWSLEPVAGRIDAQETPEQAARREAIEEAGLPMRDLEFIARYYVSPGAVSEYLWSYVGLADLPPEAAGLGGVAAEHEDIRAHVVPFARVLEMVVSGEVENAPLLVSVQWLAANRDRLRARR